MESTFVLQESNVFLFNVYGERKALERSYQGKNTFFLPVPELVGDLHALISFYVQTIKTKTMIRFSPE